MSALTPTEAAALLDALKNPPPTWAAMEAILRQWHEQSLGDPEYLWMDRSFEDMADAVNQAVICAKWPQETTPDDSWMARQDAA